MTGFINHGQFQDTINYKRLIEVQSSQSTGYKKVVSAKQAKVFKKRSTGKRLVRKPSFN